MIIVSRLPIPAGSSVYTGVVTFKRQDRTDIKAAMLVSNCAACHGTDGYSSGPATPSIAGLNKAYLVRTMKAYRSGERASSVMMRIAKGYTDTQIDRIADYLSKLPYKAAKQTTDAALVARGKAVHESNCVFCHAGTGNDAGFTSTLYWMVSGQLICTLLWKIIMQGAAIIYLSKWLISSRVLKPCLVMMYSKRWLNTMLPPKPRHRVGMMAVVVPLIQP